MAGALARISTLAAALLALAACEVGPDYRKPDAPAPAAYKESQGWKPAEPGEAASGTAWWSVYDDAVLDQLESQVDVSNQTLKAGEAALQVARALVVEARAGLFPTIGLGASAERARVGNAGRSVTDNAFTASGTASWDLDVWGRIRRSVEASAASAQASAADLAAARLSIQGEVAADYFALRIQDETQRLLQATAALFQHSLDITRNKYEAGTAAMTDVASAEAQLESTQALAINVGIQRQQLEHAIAVLIGKAPADFAVVPVPLALKTPAVPAGLPSALLERRPDIAAAERQMAAANAEIGVAVAAFYPDISLSATASFAATALSSLFNASNLVWAVGPALSETLFEGGLRSAELEAAHGTYDEQVALYRQTVLTAFQQVEDQLAALRILEQEAAVQAAAVRASEEAASLALNQYEAGTVDYTTVITAQATALGSEETSLGILNQRAAASVGLIQALGGGWDASQLPAMQEGVMDPILP
ncbi:MAG TPA: efflux transporter outer membrane subunit [Candidatus Udaeobacter sp.]|nr:efflux transporter outer membrane subunit [Candidatus Udaeobacter sp.]